jgi:hypothetical protein
MNETEIFKHLESVPTAALAETTERLIAPHLGVDEPEAAASQMSELAELPAGSARTIERLAQEAAQSSQSELANVMRMVLADFSSEDAENKSAVISSTADAGSKLIVIGPELYGICTLLVAGYVAVRTGGKKSTDKEIEISIAEDGRTVFKIRERTTYLDPFGPLSKLLKMVMNVGDDGDA